MKNHIQKLYSLVAASLLLGSAGYAAPVTYEFSGAEIPLWDLTGTYSLSPTVGGDVAIGFEITVNHDSKGSISGTGSSKVYIDGLEADGNYVVKGKFVPSSSASRVTANIKVNGSGDFGGAIRSFSLSAVYNLLLDAATTSLSGSGRGSAKAEGLGAGSITDDFSSDLPENMSGAWSLTVDVQPNGKKLTGGAILMLANGRDISFSAKGTQSATGLSKITLTGVGEDNGAKLTLTRQGDQLLSMKGKVLGQIIHR